MHIRCTAVAIVVLAAFMMTACGGGGGGGFADDGSASGMLARLNAVRTGSGNPALASNAELQAIAQAHAQYMAAIAQLKPSDAAGTDILTLMTDAGFNGNGRIFANGQTEAKVFSSINADQSNHDLFTVEQYTLCGIGYATTSNTQWWCILVSEGEAP